jgi:hypothetical protein
MMLLSRKSSASNKVKKIVLSPKKDMSYLCDVSIKEVSGNFLILILKKKAGKNG